MVISTRGPRTRGFRGYVGAQRRRAIPDSAACTMPGQVLPRLWSTVPTRTKPLSASPLRSSHWRQIRFAADRGAPVLV